MLNFFILQCFDICVLLLFSLNDARQSCQVTVALHMYAVPGTLKVQQTTDR